MENSDKEIIQWIQIAKGDTAGHEFHGNQYSSASAVGVAESLVGLPTNRAGHESLAKFHTERAGALREEADRFREDPSNLFSDEDGTPHSDSDRDYAEETAKAYEAAAGKHDEAAAIHAVAEMSAERDNPVTAYFRTKEAHEAEEGLDSDYEEQVGQAMGQL
jgi:hypothetical protein